jgi:hypothetical protein
VLLNVRVRPGASIVCKYVQYVKYVIHSKGGAPALLKLRTVGPYLRGRAAPPAATATSLVDRGEHP